jgi:2-iminobutanoate/2-iminopropanoate deaminase
MAFNRRKFLQTSGASAIAAASLTAVSAQTPKQAAQNEKTTTTGGKPKATTHAPTAKAATKKVKRKVTAPNAPKPAGPYSPAIVSGNMVFVAGQVAFDPRTGNIEATTFEDQATQVFENIKAIVEAAGSTLDKVLSVRVYLADLNDFAKMNTIYRQYFSEDFPARTTIGAQLLSKALIEVDCIAAI